MAIDNATLLDQLPDAVIAADRSGIIRYWNASAERIFGVAADEALGSSLDIIIPESFREAHWRGFDQALATNTTKYAGESLPTRAIHHDGHEIYVELSFSLIAGDGEPAGALACARDITERFQADRASRRRLRELQAENEQLRAGGAAPDLDA